MKRFLAVSATLFAMSATPVFAADSVATVNGKHIKESWVKHIMKDAKTKGQKESTQLKAAIINELIGSELAHQAAKKAGIDKRADFKINEELARRKLLVNAYLQDYMSKNPVTEVEKKKAYADYKKELGTTEYSAKHILVKTEAEAKDIIAKLNKGGDFAKLAKEKSLDPGSKKKGGDLGWFPAAGMVKPFSDAVVSMKKGAISKTPVQSQFGWHVIKKVNSRPIKAPSYDKVKGGIERKLQQQKLEKLMLGLKQKAKINVTGLPKK